MHQYLHDRVLFRQDTQEIIQIVMTQTTCYIQIQCGTWIQMAMDLQPVLHKRPVLIHERRGIYRAN